MAVAPPAITAAILAAGPTLKGTTWVAYATGVGIGVAAWAPIPVNCLIMGTTLGIMGGGAVTGKVVIPPNVPAVVASVKASSAVGLVSTEMATAIALGVASAYSATGQYSGMSVGAIGANQSKIVWANGPTLITQLIAGLASQAIVGAAGLTIANGLGPGIATMFLGGTGTGVAVGPPAPLPGIGVSTGIVF